MALALAGVWLVLLFVLLRWQRLREERGWPTWLTLTLERNEQYLYLRQTVERQLGELSDTCDLATLRHRTMREDEARVLLRAAVEIVDLLVPDLVQRLREWSRIAWALERVCPTRNLSAAQLKVWRLRGVAAVWMALDAALTTARERFRLRSWVLRGALRIVAASFHDLVIGGSTAGARWRRVEALRADLSTLSHASLDTYDALLRSLELRALTVR